jgi:hypothetical protein
MQFRRILFLTALACAASLAVSASRAEEPYRFLKEIPVGGEGGWDYLTVDSAAHRLYISHASKFVVIDTEKNEVVGEIADTPGAHGIALAPKLGRGFTTNGRENKVSIVDLATLKTLGKIETGQNPDAILFEPRSGEVYAFNGRGQSATVFEAASGKVVATIPLGGKPEFAQLDPDAGRIYNNLEDKSEVVAIDTKTHAVVARWPLAPGAEPTGLAIDVAHHRLFAGCGNAKLVMLDSTNGKVVATVEAGAGIDGTMFDPGTQLAFTSNGASGTVTIAHEDSPQKLTVVQTLATERGAKTMVVDPATHRIYLGAAKYITSEGGGKKKAAMIPGTFRVLVYGMK